MFVYLRTYLPTHRWFYACVLNVPSTETNEGSLFFYKVYDYIKQVSYFTNRLYSQCAYWYNFMVFNQFKYSDYLYILIIAIRYRLFAVMFAQIRVYFYFLIQIILNIVDDLSLEFIFKHFLKQHFSVFESKLFTRKTAQRNLKLIRSS